MMSEAYESNPEVLCGFYCQRRWCGNCRDNGYLGHGSFLNQLEADPAEEAKNLVGERKLVLQKIMDYEFD